MRAEDPSVKRETPFWSSLPGILTGLAAVLGATVALLTAFGLTGSGDEPNSASSGAAPGPVGATRSTASASIAVPRQGEGVCFKQPFRGASKGVAESDDLWIVLYSPDIERFFPGDPAERIIRRDGTRWSGVAVVGKSKGADVGAPYELQIVSASATASRWLADFASGAARDVGLQSLPKGTKTLAKVFVTKDAC
jgi:hypothetical protein